ncbi:hypothetical protein BpOF4_09110 [Alkalihalophilus pseudofirmus OF4]|uniref:Uncharacterized protein n=2 Tax=Alkalihalophilus TaxID=2893060 RepID=D3FRW8_ALKPO|nr:hypothetical protein BpOF4_09110 [Alkalihalophilus pseudofirmus OF4]ERN52610.1 hypothetical protein A33I_00735 [Alkalihalophilus marmarensis DSM 21297]
MKLSNKALFIIIASVTALYGILYWVIGHFLTT